MKGVELPINVMIIVVLAIIVLIAVAVLFFGAWNPGKGSISLETAKNSACQILVSRGCDIHPNAIQISDFDADNDNSNDPTGGLAANCGPGGSGTGDTLWSLCVCQLNILQSTDGCKKCMMNVCGCSKDACS